MYALGVDFGGGASKVTLLDDKGRVVATASCEYPTFYGEVARQSKILWIGIGRLVKIFVRLSRG